METVRRLSSETLPSWLAALGRALPVTCRQETVRRALPGKPGEFLRRIPGGILTCGRRGSTVALASLSVFFFRLAENRARARDLLDRQTMY
jgi:hypothetical protein